MGNAQLKDMVDEGEDFVDELKPGTKLMHGQYEIERFLNAGGFGITYLAKDSLDRKIVIKECFPGAFCRRSKTIVQARSRAHQPELKSIVRLFVQEARSLSKLNHPNIVGVHQVFEDNDTAYMALDFVEGRDLLDTLEDPNHGLNPAQIKSILTDILGAIGFIHEQGMLHRDISPDNILIDENMRPVLIDFGAAREQATKQSRVLSALRVVKDGYSPQEFYIAGSEQNASSDLYALGASFYHLIANEVPPNSQARLAAIASGEADTYVPLVDRVKGYDRDFLSALDMSLQVLPKDRVQSADDWLSMMNGKRVVSKKADVVAAAASDVVAPAKSKSNLPILMASVAVVALLGVAVATQTDMFAADAPVEEATQETVAPVVTQPEPEEAAVVAPPVAPVETVQAEPVVAPVEETLVEDAVVEDTPVEDTPVETVEVEPTVSPVQDAPLAEIETAVVEEAPDLIPSEPEIPVVASAPVIFGPKIIADADSFGDEGPLVEAITTSDTGLIQSSLRPSTRPDGLGVVEEVVVPLPTPEVTPDMIRDAAVLASLPGFLGNVPVAADAGTPVLALPEVPDDILNEVIAISFDQPALVPGNEIIEEPAPVEVVEPVIVETEDVAAPVVPEVEETQFILSGWSIEPPFIPSLTEPNKIAVATVAAPVWAEEGVIVKSVNGFPVDAIGDISKTLRDNVNLGDASEVLVSFEIEKDGAVSTHDLAMTIKQDFQLLNGTRFSARFANDVWTTVVSEVPQGVNTQLQIGDELIAYIPTSSKIDTRTALQDVLAAGIEDGTTQFSFAVNRENSMWVAGLEYDANPVND